jgi:hypothetical protein
MSPYRASLAAVSIERGVAFTAYFTDQEPVDARLTDVDLTASSCCWPRGNPRDLGTLRHWPRTRVPRAARLRAESRPTRSPNRQRMTGICAFRPPTEALIAQLKSRDRGRFRPECADANSGQPRGSCPGSAGGDLRIEVDGLVKPRRPARRMSLARPARAAALIDHLANL